MPLQTIVVAEDDRAIAELVEHHLAREGYRVVAAGDGLAALRQARAVADLLVLDVGLPGLDGYEVARTLRRERRLLPIVMLTARADEVDRVVAFEIGVDDYVAKPFSPRELVGRVKAVLRRRGDGGEDPARQPVWQFGALEIDRGAREARLDGVDVRLKPREFALLVELASNPGIAISRERLLVKVWGPDFHGDDRTVDVHVYRLRNKIEPRGSVARYVETVHGYGYKFGRR